MQINRTTDYALRILYYLGCEKRVIPSSEMAKNMKISQRYLLSIAKELKDHEYIKVGMGSIGGYSLAKSLKEITLYDVIENMEGEIIISRCRLPNNHCVAEHCVFHDAYSLLQDMLKCYLKTLTLEMLMNYPVDDWQNVTMGKLCGMYQRQRQSGEMQMQIIQPEHCLPDFDMQARDNRKQESRSC